MSLQIKICYTHVLDWHILSLFSDAVSRWKIVMGEKAPKGNGNDSSFLEMSKYTNILNYESLFSGWDSNTVPPI
jgi:hypothetical protein